MAGEKACCFVLDLAEDRQAVGKQKDKPLCYQDTKTAFRRAVHSVLDDVVCILCSAQSVTYMYHL